MDNGASSSRRGGGGETVLIDHGQLRSSCGYCKSSRSTSISHGLWAKSIRADDYQDLLDRGWRRSGCFLYKPEMESTCCPPYTIRLKASDFIPSKGQLRVQKKMQRLLDGMLNPRKLDHSEESNSANYRTDFGDNAKKFDEEDELLKALSKVVDSAVSACVERGEFQPIPLPKAIVKNAKILAKRKLSNDLLYTSNIAFQIAALLNQVKSAQGSNSCLNEPHIIAEILSSSIKWDNKLLPLSIKACNGHLNFYSRADQSDYSHLQAAERSIGKNEESRPIDTSAKISIKKQKLEIKTKRSSFNPEEFALYKRYQINVHGDSPHKVTESSYRRFLVDSPIIFVSPANNAKNVPPCGFGSFHQQYLIDGKLVAVAVVDILPKCLSSKYLFWDPDFAFLSLGKYSALHEISWVKDLHDRCSSLEYYYLGYYIHSCDKMRYKAAYRPSEILCPLRYSWVPFDIARPLLDKRPFVVLSDFATQLRKDSSNSSIDLCDYNAGNTTFGNEDNVACVDPKILDASKPLPNAPTSFNFSSILIDLHGSRLRFKDLQHVFGPIDKRFIRDLELQLQRYIKVLGNELCSHFIYSLG